MRCHCTRPVQQLNTIPTTAALTDRMHTRNDLGRMIVKLMHLFKTSHEVLQKMPEVDRFVLAKIHIGVPAGQKGRGHDLLGRCLAAAQPAHPCQPKAQWKPQSEGHHSTGTGPYQDCPWRYPPQCSATDHVPLGTLIYCTYTYVDTMDHINR